MPFIGPRFRSRASKLPANNRMLAGKLWVMDPVTGAKGLYSDVYGVTLSTASLRESVWDESHPGPPFKTGGPFASVKIQRPQHLLQDSGWYKTDVPWGSSFYFYYEGGFFDPEWIPQLDSIPESEYNSLGTGYSTLFPDISALGDEAYSKLRPRIEQVSVAVALAESRDLPRMLKTSAGLFHDAWKQIDARSSLGRAIRGSKRVRWRMQPKKAADNFLNHQFGWVPFLSDMSKIAKTWREASIIKSRLNRQNGKELKRHTRIKRLLESESVVHQRTDFHGCQPSGWPFYGMLLPGAPVKYTITLKEYTDIWYEGVFKFYRPEFDRSLDGYNSVYREVQRNMALYGINVNPSTVWAATPWSWLIDWFTNTRNVIQRLEDMGTDQIASKYMYLMHHRQRIFELHSQFTTKDGKYHDLYWYRAADIKRRQEASSSFGFNLATSSLTGRQIAILGALGISRV